MSFWALAQIVMAPTGIPETGTRPGQGGQMTVGVMSLSGAPAPFSVASPRPRLSAPASRLRHVPDATVVIVVGRSEHGYHHVLGSVPQALERHAHYPVIVIA